MNTNQNNNSEKKEKCYVLDMFPYPSGDGLHVGHPKGYIATDIYSRFKKMNNFDVIHPMGWDAFGLPAEQYAIKNKINPKQAVEKNIANFKSQLEKINLDYDWDRELSTTDPKFYKWTQWIFKQLYKKGLAFESYEPINWCPSCKTGLANEDLEGNACERCGTVVEKKPLRQWNLKITEYADRLITDLNTLDKWPEWVKTAQKNWIGKSEGSEIDFKIVGDKDIFFSENNNSNLVGYGTHIEMNTKYNFESKFKIFTTRADTLFGCTYAVLAPEHILVKELLEDKDNKNILQNKKEVQDYIELVKSKTDIERGAEGKEKTGVKLEGVMAINPANQKEIPVYIADYVLASYGTGAIMAVPAHDERDFLFAKFYRIYSKNVISLNDVKDFIYISRGGVGNSPLFLRSFQYKYLGELYFGIEVLGERMYSHEGPLVDSEQFDGLTSEEAKVKITDYVGGKVVSKYKLRDWVFARQRYWGEPFPVVYATKINEETREVERDNSVAPIMVADSELPVLLPPVESYEPTGTGESPLAIIDSFVNVYGYLNDEGEFESVNGVHSEKENKTIETYNNNSSKYIELTATDESEISIEFKKELDDLSLLLKNKNVLEIGSAAGRDASYLKNNEVNIIVSDIANSFEKNLIDKDFKFLNLDPLCDDLGNKKYDAILSFASLLHSEIYNIKKIIRKINTALLDNGYVHLRLKNGEGFIEEESKGGYRFFTFINKEVIEKILRNSGFEVEKITYCEDEKWINVLAKKIEHLEPKLFKRETNTMPQWAGSSWYYLRFLDPHNDNFLIDPKIESEWQTKSSGTSDENNNKTVDVYVGGDHATRHLIYARFWHKFLYDIGVVTTSEPFNRLEFLGFILAEDGTKMSKSKGNTINPDSVVDEYGSDAFRIYEMFMAPFEATAVWSTSSIKGVKRFVERVEKLKNKLEEDTKNNISNNSCTNQNIIHQTIKKVGMDIESFKFNTCVSQLMICLNEFEEKGCSREEFEDFLKILAPFAPTLCADYLKSDWPIYNENKLVANTVNIALQINGKLRATFEAELNADDEAIKELAKNTEAYKKYVLEALDEDGKIKEGSEPKKIIVVKNKIVNVVI